MSSINTNISAYYAQNNLRTAANAAQSSIARLSSGNAIVSASDNVSGLAIGTILRTDVSTLKTASTNASQGISLLQVTDGALSSLGEIVQRQKSLAVQANSGTLSDRERGYLNQEFQALTDEYNQIVGGTNFNGVNLLDGSIASAGSLKTSGPAATGNYDVRTTSTSTAYLDNSTGVNNTGFVAAGFSVTTATSNSFFGSLANATVTGSQVTDASDADNVALSITINGVQYAGQSVLDQSAGGNIDFKATDGSGQIFRLAFKAAAGAAISTQAHADSFAAGLQAELRKVTVYQGRSIDTTSGITAASLSNTALAGIDGSKFTLVGTDFKAISGSTTGANLPSIGAFQVLSNSSTDASFYINIGGHTYKNEHVTVDNAVKNNNLGGGTGVLKLTSVDDANSSFSIDIQNLTGDIDLSNATAAKSFQDAVNKAFGSSSYGGLDFQVGTGSGDAINISSNSLSSTNVYKDASGVSQNLDISTQAGARTASTVLDNAISTLTSARSTVGALQERFNYATATLGTSIQNLDAARSAFLDTDVSAESTKLATQQVLQQAAISVLAQANQIPQNLLKLIG